MQTTSHAVAMLGRHVHPHGQPHAGNGHNDMHTDMAEIFIALGVGPTGGAHSWAWPEVAQNYIDADAPLHALTCSRTHASLADAQSQRMHSH
jgi:hypothetical protein